MDHESETLDVLISIITLLAALGMGGISGYHYSTLDDCQQCDSCSIKMTTTKREGGPSAI
jgi:hypothetical protein